MLKQQLVLENLCARYGVALPAEDEAELAAQRAAYIEQYGGEDGYLAELYKLGIGDESFLRLMRAGRLYQALYDSYATPGSALYADDDVLRAYAAGAGWITADHILLMTIDQQTREPLPSAAVAEKRALAEDLLWRLRDSAEPVALFGELADEYSEDAGRQSNPEGYTFTRGTMVESFDSAARALEEGEYSDIVESEYGFHIILRRPLDVAAAVRAVRPEYFEAFFLGELERAELTCSPLVDRFDPAAIYAALLDAQGGAGEAPDAAP
nr:peptidyl-prolyl cis-trans isomerase [Oscillospiraceae bacterium]